METPSPAHGASSTAGDHQAHEQQLAAALRDLLQQIDLSDYRDGEGRPVTGSPAFQRAQHLVDQFGLTHEQLCSSLDDCSGDMDEAARKLIQTRTADPSDVPAAYRTWTTGP